ncbi:MAG TPA: hypothetical protein VI140_07425 [Oxalicibacterium sp.]
MMTSMMDSPGRPVAAKASSQSLSVADIGDHHILLSEKRRCCQPACGRNEKCAGKTQANAVPIKKPAEAGFAQNTACSDQYDAGDQSDQE